LLPNRYLNVLDRRGHEDIGLVTSKTSNYKGDEVKAKEMQIGVTYMANAGYGREISNYYDEKQLRERYSWTLIGFKDKYSGAKFAEMRNTFDDRVREIPLSKVVGKFEEELVKYLEEKEARELARVKSAEAKIKADELYETVTKPKLQEFRSLLKESGVDVWISDWKRGEIEIHYSQNSLDKLIQLIKGDKK